MSHTFEFVTLCPFSGAVEETTTSNIVRDLACMGSAYKGKPGIVENYGTVSGSHESGLPTFHGFAGPMFTNRNSRGLPVVVYRQWETV